MSIQPFSLVHPACQPWIPGRTTTGTSQLSSTRHKTTAAAGGRTKAPPAFFAAPYPRSIPIPRSIPSAFQPQVSAHLLRQQPPRSPRHLSPARTYSTSEGAAALATEHTPVPVVLMVSSLISPAQRIARPGAGGRRPKAKGISRHPFTFGSIEQAFLMRQMVIGAVQSTDGRKAQSLSSLSMIPLGLSIGGCAAGAGYGIGGLCGYLAVSSC